jgi:glycerophosphoryl diester phosphodiesterase
VAHRGANDRRAEMTIGAYRAAVSEGADALECDVRLTADWQLVAIHDRLVDRTSNGTGSVSRYPLAQLQAMDFGSWKYNSPGGEPELAADPANCQVATLRDILDIAVGAGREIGVAIETKHPTRFVGAVERAVAELLAEYDVVGRRGTGRVWVQIMSFSSLAVRRFARIRPDLPTMFLVEDIPPARYLLSTAPASARAVGLDRGLLVSAPEVVAEQQAEGRTVFVWTVDEPADVQRCLDLGVDGIITNRPGAVRQQVLAAS